jgi:hypothetical protein
MAIRAPSISLAALLTAGALLAPATPAQAEPATAKLRVSAEVVVSCRLAASVPRVGAPQRATAGASFSVRCTRGGSATTADCPATCAPVRTAAARSEYRLAEPTSDGVTVATVLF